MLHWNLPIKYAPDKAAIHTHEKRYEMHVAEFGWLVSLLLWWYSQFRIRIVRLVSVQIDQSPEMVLS